MKSTPRVRMEPSTPIRTRKGEDWETKVVPNLDMREKHAWEQGCSLEDTLGDAPGRR